MARPLCRQEICNWIMTTYNYYKYVDSKWIVCELPNMSLSNFHRVQHNSGHAFLKMERCGGDRGKGFFWDFKCLKNKKLKLCRTQLRVLEQKDGPNQPGKCKDKCTPLDLPLKQSIKRGPKGPSPRVNSFTESIV